MSLNQLKQIIQSITGIDEQSANTIINCFSETSIPEKHILCSEGQVAKDIYFISKGLIRLYYFKKTGEEVTGFLFKENLFASSFESFLRQKPSKQILETLEPCRLLVLTHEKLQQLYREVPAMNQMVRIVLEERFINAQQILSSFILDTPEERYKKFIENHPDLVLRVPLHIIASYLGITPVSLSRIRKRISQ
jgi:CRP/FNR family transcriptional regulator, anaerobic regulatory protein